jgi:hypothetical protein
MFYEADRIQQRISLSLMERWAAAYFGALGRGGRVSLVSTKKDRNMP